MTDMQTRLLSAIVAEPGEWTAADLSQLLDLPRADVDKAVHALSRRGLLAERVYRLFPHSRVPRLPTFWQEAIFEVLQRGAATRAQLASEVDAVSEAGKVNGQFASDLGDLVYGGNISGTRQLWPAEAGVALVRERRAA